jgi:predicted DsbA family dithiol-disulfide isomerase
VREIERRRMTRQPEARVVVWSDYVCPFCYLETPVLDEVREEFGDRVDVEWRAFELRPEPVPTLDPESEYLTDVWRRAVRPMARDRDVELARPPVQPRSRRALEAAEFARDRGRFEAMHRALFRAFFRDGRDLGDVDVLLDVADEVGLDREELRRALAEERYTGKVLDDQVEARERGVDGVPALFVVPAGEELEEAEVVQGAQPVERVRSAVLRALGEDPDVEREREKDVEEAS